MNPPSRIDIAVFMLIRPPVPIMTDEDGQIVVGVDTNDTAGRPSGKFVANYSLETSPDKLAADLTEKTVSPR
mgnify:CR=1 FL=1